MRIRRKDDDGSVTVTVTEKEQRTIMIALLMTINKLSDLNDLGVFNDDVMKTRCYMHIEQALDMLNELTDYGINELPDYGDITNPS